MQDTGLYYDRYLREVIDVLETDPHFREKLQTANTEDIKVSSRVSFDLEGSPFTLCTSVRSRRSTVMSTPTVGDREHDISRVFVRFEVPWQDLRVLVDGTR